MKGTMMSFTPLCLLLCWILPVHTMTIHFNFTRDRDQDQEPRQSLLLDIVEDSVDDMYFGCNEIMMTIINKKYLIEEKYVEPFKYAWSEAEQCAKKKLAHREDMALTKDHMQAICAYTGDNVYKAFNKAVHTNGSGYGSSFQFHSLHFLLTSAIQILNKNYYCHQTYRRTTRKFTGQVSQIIRFGFFASSSYRTDLKEFGHETCFKIQTCLGGYLKNYSYYDRGEEEVLIPPYEKFKITEKHDQGRFHDLRDCKVVYVLKSMGAKSDLNCKIVIP